MAHNLSEAVRIIAQAAGWKEIEPDASGAYRYHLQHHLDVTFLSPDGANCIMTADLGEVPSLDSRDGEARVRHIGALAAGIASKRASVLSMENGRLELFRRVHMPSIDSARLIDEAAAFLNDEAWWKAQLSDTAPTAQPASPFSMGGFFPADFMGSMS